MFHFLKFCLTRLLISNVVTIVLEYTFFCNISIIALLTGLDEHASPHLMISNRMYSLFFLFDLSLLSQRDYSDAEAKTKNLTIGLDDRERHMHASKCFNKSLYQQTIEQTGTV